MFCYWKTGVGKGTTTSWTRKCRPGVAACVFLFPAAPWVDVIWTWGDGGCLWGVWTSQGGLRQGAGMTSTEYVKLFYCLMSCFYLAMLWGHGGCWGCVKLSATKSFFSYACFKRRHQICLFFWGVISRYGYHYPNYLKVPVNSFTEDLQMLDIMRRASQTLVSHESSLLSLVKLEPSPEQVWKWRR